MMSDTESMMNFELLPNEILVICFEYLNAYEIFYSFDKLNFRFSKLIRNIQLQLNFENIKKIKFDRLCQIIKSNSEIQNRIYYLQLSNKDTCNQINLFLSFFSLEKFSYLRILKFFEMEEENIIKLKSILPFLSNLYSLNIMSMKYEQKQILDPLSISNHLRILSIISLHSIKTSIDQTIINVTNLKMFACSLEHLLYDIFKYFPLLKYLNVEYVSRYNHPLENTTMIQRYTGIYLKQLTFGLFRHSFEEFKIFVKQIPNLKKLIINASDDINMLNAQKWKELIQTSLPYLNDFQFKFGCNRKSYHKRIIKLFKYFQEDFWCKQHHWYTECSFEKYNAFIYTIPYILNIYTLDLYNKRFPNASKNHLNTFDQVTSVALYHKIKSDQCQYYFSNIKKLILISSKKYENIESLNISYLKTIFNLSNLISLNIIQYEKNLTNLFLLDILKEAPNLSRITMNSNYLLSILNHNEIGIYMNKMIKYLDIYKCSCSSFYNLKENKKFFEIFSNIEQLTCFIIEPNDVFFLIEHLSKLSNLNIYFPRLGDYNYFLHLFQEESYRLNFTFRISGIEMQEPQVSMWIAGNIN